MRIGILTLPLHTNYGGILQAYALQTVLERMGHEAVVFDRPLQKASLPAWKKPLSYTKRFIRKYILKRPGAHIFIEKYWYDKQKTERTYTQAFIDKYIHREVINHLSEIKEGDIDAIIVGSDQIWRMLYFDSMWDDKNEADAFLAFTDNWNIKRISYAASFGTDKTEIKPEYRGAGKAAIKKFDGVSVREKSGIEICKNEFDVDAKWVLDPTMLLKSEDYQKLFADKPQSNTEHTLASYILDETPEVSALRDKIARDKKLVVVRTNVADSGDSERGIVPQPPIENWLSSLYNADYVINDSFHACVFSILFHKQFTVIANKGRGLSRFYSLLSMFGLEDRLISSPAEYKPHPDIDYTRIDDTLNNFRRESYDFLKNNLT